MGPIILHICCAPCGTASIERLRESGYTPNLFFSNSNIFPKPEYEKRLSSVRNLAKQLRLPLYVDTYNHYEWLQTVASVPGYAQLPEGDARCTACFRFSFSRAAQKCAELGTRQFTTTLSISPHKKSDQLFTVGEEFADFVPIDFKKKDGHKRSIELSREYDLYRQNYCGCEYSRYIRG